MFSRQDILDWKAFEKVRQGGEFNMFDPRAAKAAGLGKDRYLWVIKHYSALKAEAAKGESEGKR